MADLPPEDQPDLISIGPVHDIPVFHDDDPRIVEEKAAWSEARKVAQALHSADELVSGCEHDDWRVRHESIDRLVARAHDDERTLPAILRRLATDPSWEVRSAAAMSLKAFPIDSVRDPLEHAAADDPHEDVRWSAAFVLGRVGPE